MLNLIILEPTSLKHGMFLQANPYSATKVPGVVTLLPMSLTLLMLHYVTSWSVFNLRRQSLGCYSKGLLPWAALHIKADPCSLGQLWLLTPKTSMMSQHEFLQRGKHSIHAYTPDCNDDLDFW